MVSGRRTAARQIPASRHTTETISQPPQLGEPSASQPGRVSAAELFSQLFPAGVQLTGELLDDLEQWAHLTSKLSTGGGRPQR